MAKEDMIYPFTGELCRECPIFRGRHYYLRFNKKYRGHIEKPGGDTRGNNPVTSEAEHIKQFEIPVKMPNAIDPFTVPMGDIRK